MRNISFFPVSGFRFAQLNGIDRGKKSLTVILTNDNIG